MTKLKVFISSSIDELHAEREAVRSALKNLDAEPVMWEDFHTTYRRPRRVYLDEVAGADVYLGIFADKYSRPTVTEYHHASKLGKPCLVYRREYKPHRDVKLQRFLDRIEDVLIYGTFDTPMELQSKVQSDIVNLLVMLWRQKEQERSEAEKRVKIQSAYEKSAELYGAGYEKYVIRGDLSANGAMVITRDVVLQAYGDSVQWLEFYQFAPEAPQGQPISVKGQTTDESGRRLITRQIEALPGKSRTIIEFDPELSKGETIGFTFVETLSPASFARTQEELRERGLGWEFMAWDIIRPTRELDLSVHIPLTLPILRSACDVWRGTSMLTDPKESERLPGFWSDTVEDGMRVLRLKVYLPTFQLSYVIKWIPAGRAEGT